MSYPHGLGLASIAAVLCLALPSPGQTDQQLTIEGRFSKLLPEQIALVERWTREVEKITGTRPDPQKSYDQLPISSRTTFEAVTHALIHSNLTDPSGKSLGRAIDLVDLVERIAGRVPGTRGDHQFRVYVYLKPGAIDKLYAAKEFQRGHDNAVYHVGYPLNFRQAGTPSVQFSLTRTGYRADIDVDYRSSSMAKALFDGHLTAANSDVRAGNNFKTHNDKWRDLPNWWQSILASLFGGDADKADDAAKPDEDGPIVPPVHAEWEEAAAGKVHEAVHGYLQQWLVAGDPASILRAVSVKAYPCVAEFRDGSRPDSKLALYRIMAQMQQTNRLVGKIGDLAEAVEPAVYPLPDAKPVDHPYAKLFSLQLVPDDVAWALDCRMRYGLKLAEHIPQPSHKAGAVYATAWRLKKGPPGQFRLSFWRRQGNEWKLVSFDIKHSSAPPPPDVVARIAAGHAAEAAKDAPDGPKPGPDGEVQAAAVGFFDSWLIDKKPEAALGSFAPEAYACDGFEEAAVRPESRSGEAGKARLLQSLTDITNKAGSANRLEALMAASEAGHHHLHPVPHSRAGAFLLARVSDDVAKMYRCNAKGEVRRVARQEGSGDGTYTAEVYLTAFRSAKAGGDDPAVVLLFWEKRGGQWRIVSYAVAND